MFKSDKYRFYFTHIPKTGGTSIKAALLPYANRDQIYFDGERVTDGDGFRPHMPLTKQMAWHYEKYFKFAIVRNPWGRHASIYKFLLGRDRPVVHGKSFEQYITDVYLNRNIYSRNQVQYGIKWMDYVGYFESLPIAFEEICHRIGLPRIDLMHYKDQGNYNYREMYTHKTRKMIEAHCAPDIERFKYTF